MNRAHAWGVVATCALTAWLGYAAGSRSGATPALPATRTAQAEGQSVTPASRTVSDASANLAARFADLAQRAEDGDREAARTLAEDLGRCMRLPSYEESIILQQSIADYHSTRTVLRAGESDGSAIRKRTETMQEERDATRALCAGISRAQVKSRSYWLYKAALAGDTRSALEFGTGVFIHDDLLGQLERIPFWREHAEDMLERALADGESNALLPLARAHDPMRENDQGEPAFSPDPIAAYAYYSVLSLSSGGARDIAEEALRRLDGELTDAERQQALAQAADICQNDLPDACDLGDSTSR